VGSIAIKEILKDSNFKDKLNIIFINDELSPDNLNEHCGAEFV
jgi:hypothetical protein